uniref:Peptidase S1 domain-containing protein n=1 Tax=Panagrellus redivivus TaxID=6233 RepID=A0A7E4UR02_PANRE
MLPVFCAIPFICLLFLTIATQVIGRQCGVVNLKSAPWSNQTASEPTQNHITVIGGEEAHKNDMPWVVALYVHGSYTCTGSLIASTYVLTAKHCVENIQLPMYEVYVGYGNTEKNKMQYVKVDQIFNNYWGDISILKLKAKVHTTPVCLPVSYNPDCHHGKTMVVAGLGNHVDADYNPVGAQNGSAVDNIPDNPAESVLWTKIEQLDKITCGLPPYYDSPEFCAGGLRRGTMGGDSGGPVMKVEGNRVVQIGVTSRGYTEAVNHRLFDAGIYVNVGFHANWIAWVTKGAAQFRHMRNPCYLN